MRFIKKFSLIIFIIALMAFSSFLGYQFFAYNNKSSQTETINDKVDKIIDKAEEDLHDLDSDHSSAHYSEKKQETVTSITLTHKKTPEPPVKSNDMLLEHEDITAESGEPSLSEIYDEDKRDKDALYIDNLTGSGFNDVADESIKRPANNTKTAKAPIVNNDVAKKNDALSGDEREDILADDAIFNDDLLDGDFSKTEKQAGEIAPPPSPEKPQEETSRDTSKQDQKSDLDLPKIEEIDIDQVDSAIIDNPEESILAGEDLSLDAKSDTPFNDDESLDDNALYSLLTSEDPIKESNEKEDIKTDIIENTPKDNGTNNISKDMTEADLEDDIFSDADLFDSKGNDDITPDDIFGTPDLPAGRVQQADTPTAQASEKDIKGEKQLDSEFMSQIDTPDDLFMPDVREIGKTPIMIKPTEPISEQTEQDIIEELFPSDNEAGKSLMDVDVLETNKALALKNMTEENKDNTSMNGADDLLGEDDILSNIAGIEDSDALMDTSTQTSISDNIAGQTGSSSIDENTQTNTSNNLAKTDPPLSPDEKIANAPFVTMESGSATCRFEHVIDAHTMSEQFRLTVLPPSGNAAPLKMEMVQDLSLDKFLTMKMDEVDGYPDHFSSLAVFCKEMTVSKRLIESY